MDRLDIYFILTSIVPPVEKIQFARPFVNGAVKTKREVILVKEGGAITEGGRPSTVWYVKDDTVYGGANPVTELSNKIFLYDGISDGQQDFDTDDDTLKESSE